MRRILKYKGKTIEEMTIYELKNQYSINKTRFVYRTVFFILIAISIMLYQPIVIIIPIVLAIITGYWLIENNNEIKKEMDDRLELSNLYFLKKFYKRLD